MIVSSGMAELVQLDRVCQEVYKVWSEKNINPGLALLHCVSSYPTPPEQANLNAITTLKKQFPEQIIGYSDHTLGIEVSIAAVAMGATVIEKHFTLDRNPPGPDHRASLKPDELKAMVNGIRNIEKTLGDGIKRPTPSEINNIPIVRKSLVAATAIRAGECFTEFNLAVKRPGTGISPMRWNEVLGSSAVRDYKADELIE